MERVEIALANADRVTLRVGETFLKVDADQHRTDIEVEAIRTAPVPTPEVRWRRHPVLALAALD
ncbi:MAG: aminoglycoside phosphotransferase family protein, partial [Actinomycetota bacterium]